MPTVLYVTHRVPFPPDKGDRIRTYHILRFLASRAQVFLACLSDEPVSNETRAELGKLAQRVAIVPNENSWRWVRGLWSLACGSTVSEGVFTHRELLNLLQNWSRETNFDSVLFSASSLAQYAELKGLSEVPCCFDMIDVDSEKWREYSLNSSFPRSWIYGTESSRLRNTERRIVQRSQSVVLVSQAECNLLRNFCPDGEIRAVPNGVDFDYFQPLEDVGDPVCAFVGALDYRPNVDAVIWFANEVWPRVKAREASARFLIIGRRAISEVESLGSRPGIEIVGEVPDIRVPVKQASIVVAPLKIARGIQNKVLEGMSLQRAVVASSEALIGIDAKIGQDVLEANSPDEWVDRLSLLWSDGGLRRQIASNGREFVERSHQWNQCLAPLAKLLRLE